jgi:transitional endoplasmic reticulum ATPase
MSNAHQFAAEGKAYASAARSKEEQGRLDEAKSLYLKAASAFLEASKGSNNASEKNLRQQLAETFYGKAMAIISQRAVKTGHVAGKGASPDDETIKVVPIEKPDINFSYVGGLDDVKNEIRKAIVYPFQHPEIYEHYRKKIGEGILMYGPPGCGKTFIAKAAAGECGASFITLKVGEILSKWLGESEKNVKAAFEAAKKHQPSILFFDEIDAIGGKRDESSDASKRVVNALLVELDGVTTTKDKRLVLAATNAPWDVDPALRRPGRFSKLLFLPPPDLESRKQIFKLGTKDRPLESNIDFESLARKTDGYSSADIIQICDEAADVPLEEALEGKPPRMINQSDFLAVIEKRKSSIIPWFRLANNQIKESGEQEEFSELLRVIDNYI